MKEVPGVILFWSESAIPVRKNLNTAEGKEEFGLNDIEFSGMEIVQALRLNGDDASCLNLNHVKTPPVLGIDPSDFIRRNSFSFVTSIAAAKEKSPWSLLDSVAGDNIIFGIADQTVTEMGFENKYRRYSCIYARNRQTIENSYLC